MAVKTSKKKKTHFPEKGILGLKMTRSKKSSSNKRRTSNMGGGFSLSKI